MSTQLRADVFTQPALPIQVQGARPEGVEPMFSPMSVTLISGAREAVLVDTTWTIEGTNQLAQWIQDSGKELTTIYITHGHADHFFGLGELLKRFPNAHPVATSAVREIAQKNASGDTLAFWDSLFPGQLPTSIQVPESLANNTLSLEGQILQVHEGGRGDTEQNSFLHVPSLELVVAGDIVYNEVHQYFGETNSAPALEAWIDTLDSIGRLRPAKIIAGHKRPGTNDDPSTLETTRAYIRAFAKLLAEADGPEDLFWRMRGLYPPWTNEYMLWMSCTMATASR